MKTITADKCSIIYMSCHPKAKHTTVIDDGHVRNWVGIGWVDHGKATEADYKKYPTVTREDDQHINKNKV